MVTIQNRLSKLFLDRDNFFLTPSHVLIPRTIETIVSGGIRALQLSVPAQPVDMINSVGDRGVARSAAGVRRGRHARAERAGQRDAAGVRNFARLP
jgi:hypothetical protein